MPERDKDKVVKFLSVSIALPWLEASPFQQLPEPAALEAPCHRDTLA